MEPQGLEIRSLVNYDEMLACGVSAIFGPGTNILLAAREVLDIVRQRGSQE